MELAGMQILKIIFCVAKLSPRKFVSNDTPLSNSDSTNFLAPSSTIGIIILFSTYKLDILKMVSPAVLILIFDY